MPSTTFYNLKYAKQKEMLDSAILLFAKKDFDELSVRSISKELGITTGAFYRYFGAKEEFYVFMVDYTLEQYWERQKHLMEESGHPVSMQDVFEKDPVQADFWKNFYRSSLEIRLKYYFRTKDNPLYKRKLQDICALKMADTYSQEEKEVAAFAVSVLQYVVTSFKYLEHRNFDDEEMFQVLNKMLLNGFKLGKPEEEPHLEHQSPVSGDFDE
ncbi:MAG: TetR/AcrR family transcriptional regulator [Lachnospiraceae bacterium]